jgi:hypothetical protein
MINANELRVGNWVNDELYGDFQIVGLINFKDGNQSAFKSLEYYPQSQDTDKLNPIPLTEEWLLKFGFEESIKSNSYRILSSKNEWIIAAQMSTDKKCCKIGLPIDFRIDQYMTHIHFVHQLQNIYFALTNEELICHT